MNIAAAVVTVGMSTDECLMTGKVFFSLRWMKKTLFLPNRACRSSKPSLKPTKTSSVKKSVWHFLMLLSFEDFAEKLLRRGITVKESRGRLSYLTPDRTRPITARKLGDDFDM